MHSKALFTADAPVSPKGKRVFAGLTWKSCQTLGKLISNSVFVNPSIWPKFTSFKFELTIGAIPNDSAEGLAVEILRLSADV